MIAFGRGRARRRRAHATGGRSARRTIRPRWPALVGGGSRARPGEVSLAHHGVLFLDELPEFQPQVLDCLRQPLETGEVAIARANHRVIYPARFQLVAAMNPCRCGHATEPGYACKRRTERPLHRRLSGPALRPAARPYRPAHRGAGGDRRRPDAAAAERRAREVAARVARARDIQAERYAAMGCRERAHQRAARRPCAGRGRAGRRRGAACCAMPPTSMRLSARGYHRVLQVARTLADLDAADSVGRVHLAEALSYRALADDVRRAA